MAFLIKRKEKFMRETVRNEDGSSLISVIVAFVILTLGILMVTTAVKVSLGLFQSVIGLVLVLGADFISKRLGEEGLI